MNRVHCWFDFEDGYYENPYTDEERRVPGHTCMLERDHDGPHEPTRDDEIRVSVSDGGEDRP